jgi:hypothetical protein
MSDQSNPDPVVEEAIEVEDIEEASTEAYDRHQVLELGDRAIIDSERYGVVWGTIYYRSNDMLRLRPDGAGNILYEFPRLYTEDEDAFVADLGVKESYILLKRNKDRTDFVQQQDFRVGLLVDGIDKEGLVTATYQITAVNEEEDSIQIVNLEDESDVQDLVFGAVGIPEEAPFRILRISTKPKPVKEEEKELKLEEEEEEAEEEEGEDEEDEDLEILDTDDFEVELEGQVLLPQQTIYKEATASRKIIPENIQKSEALKDFLNMLDPSQQKDPKAIREFRILVETMTHMKRAIMELNPDGSFKGLQSPSASTLVELLQKTTVPMGKPVLDVKKRLYASYVQETPEEAPYRFEKDGIPTISTTPSTSTFVESGALQQIHFYATDQSQYERWERPWKSGNDSGLLMDFDQDTLFFRNVIPDMDDATLEAYERAPPKEKDALSQPYPSVGLLNYGLETALSRTYRKGRKGDKHVLLASEMAPIRAYLLFPQAVAAYMGTKRSGSLALDMTRAANINMATILNEQPLVPDSNKTDQIVALSISGNTLANIPLADYLEGMTIPGTGIGDMMNTLVDYGIPNLELTPEILAVLQVKISNYQGQLITSLNQVREAIKELEPPIPNPILPIESTPVLDTLFRSEMILVNILKAFTEQNPVLKDSDVARIAHFLRINGDYYQTAIGKQDLLLIPERDKAIKTIQLTMIHEDEQIKRNKREKGEVPVPNLCKHVSELKAVRKVREEADRYVLLIAFLRTYQGKRSENWIDCNLCKKELLCVHERLLIKAFLSPKERETLFKELHLHFSGGVFAGHYICRNCGQPIQEIGYDTNIQFDDSGKPMIGRAELKDKDALRASDLEAILGLPLEAEDEFEFEDVTHRKYYKIVREIAERVGIFMNQAQYESVIKKMVLLSNSWPDREEFVAMQEARAKKKRAAGQPFEMPDYDALIAKNTIGSAALHLLLEIQTRIPDYKPQFSLPNCEAGFGGYPLDDDEEQVEGLQYMACAIASIQREDEPWASARFYKIPSGKKREDQIAAILSYIKPILGDILDEQGATLTQKLSEKRVYLEAQQKDQVQRLTKPTEEVPSSFLPELVLPPVVEAAAEKETEPSQDPRSNARAWIRNAHELAKRTSNPIRGSFVSDITCCRVGVQTPGAFWQSKADLAPLPFANRQLMPAKRGSFQQFNFEARNHDPMVVDIPKDLTYRLFLHTCAKGDTKGSPHEIGATNQCRLCHFQLPEHPSLITPDKAKTAVTEAEIDESQEAFQELLDLVHRKNSIAPTVEESEARTWVQVLEELRDLTPMPLPNWPSLFSDTIKALNRLKGNNGMEVNSGDVAEATAELSNAVSAAETFVQEIIVAKGKYKNPVKKHEILEKLGTLPWHNFVQAMETYLITPAKTLLNQYDTERLEFFFDPQTIPSHAKKYAPSHMQDLRDVLDEDHAVLNTFVEDLNTDEKQFARDKLAQYVKQMSAIALLKNRLRPIYFIGGADTFQHIQQAFLYGPLADLFNSSKLPDVERAEEDVPLTKKGLALFDTSVGMLIKIMGANLDQFSKHRLGYSDDELREIIQERAEREKQNILSKLDKMSDEERRAATLNMRLGLGRYNVDKLKSIIKYSAEQIELERKEGEEAGIIMSLSRSRIGEDDMEVEGVFGDGEDEGGFDEEAAEAAEGFDDHHGSGEADEFANDE